ncbi:MAG: hypothetical protein A4E46_01820 [Methanosaeta sp. PtaU1.Bin016]|nr:MAG: hypothetical protein A4E46_01820 [Methanosaeta sp. PtaU1.Bin016]
MTSRSAKAAKSIFFRMAKTSALGLMILMRSLSLRPRIAGGRWKAMPMPSLALSSMDIFVISLPLKTIRPPSTLYLGIPAITFKRVVLPVPLGPKRAWVSPDPILRLKFFRTCLLPMLADRSTISSSHITSNDLT